jgi:hypothetical protein
MSNQFNYYDPYEDLILSLLISPAEAIRLSRQEYKILAANIRSEIVYSKQIKEILTRKARDVIKQMKMEQNNTPFKRK